LEKKEKKKSQRGVRYRDEGGKKKRGEKERGGVSHSLRERRVGPLFHLGGRGGPRGRKKKKKVIVSQLKGGDFEWGARGGAWGLLEGKSLVASLGGGNGKILSGEGHMVWKFREGGVPVFLNKKEKKKNKE